MGSRAGTQLSVERTIERGWFSGGTYMQFIPMTDPGLGKVWTRRLQFHSDGFLPFGVGIIRESYNSPSGALRNRARCLSKAFSVLSPL
jgi:hypothetical protein